MSEVVVVSKSAAAIFGVGIGLLTGFASSPVIGGVVSSLLTAAFLVLSLTPERSKLQLGNAHVAAVAAFVIALVLGSGAGLWLRASSIIFPSPQAIDFRELTDLGIEDESARAAVLTKYLDGAEMGKTTGLNAAPAVLNSNILRTIIGMNWETLRRLEAEDAKDAGAIVNDIRAQTRRSALQLRRAVEAKIGDRAAFIWYEIHVAPVSENEAISSRFMTEEPDAFQIYLDFVNGVQ